MNKVIIYKTENSGVAVLFPALEWENQLEKLAVKDVPQNTSYRIIDITELPQHPEFREAWKWNNNTGIEVDILKAKEIQKNEFRAARKPILERLDIDYMRALETGNIQKMQDVAAQKQELRDVTNTPLPDDLEGIKNTWPNVLKS